MVDGALTAMGPQRSAEKEAYWRKVMERHKASELSARAFCAREGLSEASFHAWRRTLRARDGETRASRGAANPAAAIIPVTILEPSAACEPSAAREECPLLEVLTPAGITLRFPPTLAASQLRAYVDAITAQEALPC